MGQLCPLDSAPDRRAQGNRHRHRSWTDFDRDGQATLALNLVTGHGRATPLLWLTVWKDELTERRNDFEGCLPEAAAELIAARLSPSRSSPTGVLATTSCSRFLMIWASTMSSGFRGNIHITDATVRDPPGRGMGWQSQAAHAELR